MQINAVRTLVIIFICAACTFAERALPFVLFRGKEIPSPVRYLGRVLPMAVMTTLIVYCIKDISFASAGAFLPYLLGIAVTAGLHLWKGSSLLSIAGGTLCYMLLVQFVF